MKTRNQNPTKRTERNNLALANIHVLTPGRLPRPDDKGNKKNGKKFYIKKRFKHRI